MMVGFLLRRAALVIPTFLGVTLIAFALIHLIPGDAVENLSGERGMDPARRERLLHEFGLDRPLAVQYGEYLRNAFVRGQRRTEVSAEHLSDVRQVLDRQRTVESELMQQPLAPRGIHAALARQVLDRIARDEMDQRERQQRHTEKRRYDQRDAAEEEAEQR